MRIMVFVENELIDVYSLQVSYVTDDVKYMYLFCH